LCFEANPEIGFLSRNSPERKPLIQQALDAQSGSFQRRKISDSEANPTRRRPFTSQRFALDLNRAK
jgi:hypothetical protein